MIGSLLTVVAHLLKPLEPESKEGIEAFISSALLSDMLLIIAVPIVMLGLVGIFLYQADRFGWWGWVGYLLFGIGLMYIDIVQPVIRLVAYPWVLKDVNTKDDIFTAVTTVYDQDPFAYLFPIMFFVIIAPIWTSVTFWKAKVFPVWSAIALLLFIPLFILGPFTNIDTLAPAFIYLVFGLYGFFMARNNRGLASHPPKNVIEA